jgi:hypothetical protein
MEQKDKFIEINDEYALAVFESAKEHFGNGIYVKAKDQHPCGWDFISFEYMDEYDDHIELGDISNGVYDIHDYSYLNLLDVLKIVGMKGWCFELNGVDYLE